RRAEARAESRAGEEQLLQTERVLPEPQHALARADTVGCERAREPLDARREHRPREPPVAVGERDPIRPRPRVTVHHVGEREPGSRGHTKRKQGIVVPSRTSYQTSSAGLPIATSSASVSTMFATSRTPPVPGSSTTPAINGSASATSGITACRMIV